MSEDKPATDNWTLTMESFVVDKCFYDIGSGDLRELWDEDLDTVNTLLGVQDAATSHSCRAAPFTSSSFTPGSLNALETISAKKNTNRTYIFRSSSYRVANEYARGLRKCLCHIFAFLENITYIFWKLQALPKKLACRNFKEF